MLTGNRLNNFIMKSYSILCNIPCGLPPKRAHGSLLSNALLAPTILGGSCGAAAGACSRGCACGRPLWAENLLLNQQGVNREYNIILIITLNDFRTNPTKTN